MSTTSLAIGHVTLHPQERVVFGKPAAEAVREELVRIGADRAFVTSTASLARAEHGPLQRIIEALGPVCVGVHDAIGAHSPEADVVDAANAAREAGAQALVAVGGGSVIDATKAMQMCLWEGIETVDAMRGASGRYASGTSGRQGGDVRMIAVSTTLSAAEFTPNAGITDKSAGRKIAYSNPWFVPRVAVLDPAATDCTPPDLLASTGMRAMDHAAEGFCSLDANPMSDLYALGAAAALAKSLPAILDDPEDCGARQQAQFGMWQAISAITGGAGTGASHAVGYALGAGFGVPHGATSCIMLPAVLRWNSEVNAERQKGLAAALGDAHRPAWEQMSELVARLGVPATLRDAGLTRDDLPKLAELAFAYPPMKRNPRPVASPSQIEEILDLAF